MAFYFGLVFKGQLKSELKNGKLISLRVWSAKKKSRQEI